MACRPMEMVPEQSKSGSKSLQHGGFPGLLLGSRDVIDTWSPPQSNHLLAWPLSDLTHRLSHGATFHPLPSSTTTPQGKYRFSSDHRSQVL